MIQTDWTIQEEFIYLSQRWPILVLAFLIGSLLGWGFSFLLPVEIEASTEYYVAFNGDIFPRNPDDYKNWQLEELDAFLLSDPVLQETLAILKTQENSSSLTTPETLARQLDLRWRNAGTWTLAAQSRDADQSESLLEAWSQAGSNQLAEAALYAQESLALEREIRQITSQLYHLNTQHLRLREAYSSVISWQNKLNNRPGNQPLTALERWSLMLLTGYAEKSNRFSEHLIEEMPAAEAPADQYFPFIDHMLLSLEANLTENEQTRSELEKQKNTLESLWQEAQQKARGITAYLTIEPLQGGEITITKETQTSAAVLVGGICGVLLFFLYRLILRSRL